MNSSNHLAPVRPDPLIHIFPSPLTLSIWTRTTFLAVISTAFVRRLYSLHSCSPLTLFMLPLQTPPNPTTSHPAHPPHLQPFHPYTLPPSTVSPFHRFTISSIAIHKQVFSWGREPCTGELFFIVRDIYLWDKVSLSLLENVLQMER